MSLQEYLLAELCRNAVLRTPGEVVAEVERQLSAGGADGFARTSGAGVLRTDRDSR
ncbi:MAG: hypothetical protein M4D85_08515 [Actinomycetota bacterium]|nr:hypothetical protein [Actinomycetota bacterium]